MGRIGDGEGEESMGWQSRCMGRVCGRDASVSGLREFLVSPFWLRLDRGSVGSRVGNVTRWEECGCCCLVVEVG